MGADGKTILSCSPQINPETDLASFKVQLDSSAVTTETGLISRCQYRLALTFIKHL
jgi:hypothetical protein